MGIGIVQGNVGRIAERIVANELEYRGYRVSDLNKDGLAANADLIASNSEGTWQIQVKGATQKPEDNWWVSYGFCSDSIISGNEPMFNRRNSFYIADVAVLVAVRSPTEYRCVVLPVRDAEKAAQMNLDRGYRTLTKSGERKKPHKVWAPLQPKKFEHKRDKQALKLISKERAILLSHLNWDVFPS